MTRDKDFKRLVRQRMAKTGESYSAARTKLRAPRSGNEQRESIDAFRRRMYVRSAVDGLAAHLEATYGIDVAKLTELDVGVFCVDARGGPTWVARVFPGSRTIEDVRADAEVLRCLATADFPAERCAHAEPISEMSGQGVLVTNFLPGDNLRMDVSGPTLFALGDTLGRLHTLSPTDVIDRPAGSWHHLSPEGGGLRRDVEKLRSLLTLFEPDVSETERPLFGSVQDHLHAVDDCDDLPRALIHPDPAGANFVRSNDGTPTLVDWAGAGRGPRVLGLGSLLSGALQPVPYIQPSGDHRRLDAIVAGYRRHVRLTADEVARLADAISGRGIVLACWSMLFADMPLREVTRAIDALMRSAERAAERVTQAFDLDDETLTGWYTERRPEVHPGQQELF
jgi:Ser/Thr protein kinase RdoA (MazF antagonist)